MVTGLKEYFLTGIIFLVDYLISMAMAGCTSTCVSVRRVRCVRL